MSKNFLEILTASAKPQNDSALSSSFMSFRATKPDYFHVISSERSESRNLFGNPKPGQGLEVEVYSKELRDNIRRN